MESATDEPFEALLRHTRSLAWYPKNETSVRQTKVRGRGGFAAAEAGSTLIAYR
jgi:hypothetical protein